MVHWTDSNINWQSLSAREINRLIQTWGTDEAAEAPKVKVAVKKAVKTPAKAAPKAEKAPTKARVTKKHVGADGEVKFLAHRNVYVGFANGGKIVVTRNTAEACQAYLEREYMLETTVVNG